MEIHVVGGVYRERCIHPHWNEVYGSAGRAAIAIESMGSDVVLHSYFDDTTRAVFEDARAWHPHLRLAPTAVPNSIGFRYLHDLSVPDVEPVTCKPCASLSITQSRVVSFGMLEGDAIVHAESAVYDPQNVQNPRSFGANGSTATHLALVLNMGEAQRMANMPGEHPTKVAPILAAVNNAEVVVIKMGPRGAFVWTATGVTQIQAYRTKHVWKIGSGDCFVAHFAYAWMAAGKSPAEAAADASRATAYYVETRGLPTPEALVNFAPSPIEISDDFRRGAKRTVYLAGPFFDLMQVWLVEQAREDLTEMGLKVFSPYHDVGLGPAEDVVQKDLDALNTSDVVFAITDGLDTGTVYEVGYARALGKPVIVYSERHLGETLKMMTGSDCVICSNYATALYSTLWEAARL